MIRPQQITLALIFKLTLVKSAQTTNSFGLQNRFSLNLRRVIQVDLARLSYMPLFREDGAYPFQ